MIRSLVSRSVICRMGNAKCKTTVRLDDKTAVVTGCNTGIGKCTVKDFYQRGAKVIMACRNLEKANEAAEQIKLDCKNQENVGQILVMLLDLSSLESVKKFAKAFNENEQSLHILVNNAGVFMCPYMKTEDGFEMHFGTNHLGHFLLTMLLLPKIITSSPARIVNVSSELHRPIQMDFSDLNWEKRQYNPLKAYCQSKLANVLFTKELKDRLEANNIQRVTTYSLHPGVINTELTRHIDTILFRGCRSIYDNFARLIVKTPEQGAQTTIHCSVDENSAIESGLYYLECKVMPPSKYSTSVDAVKLWKESWRMVGLEENYNPFAVNSNKYERV